MLLPPMGQQPKQAHWEARADASYHPKSLKAKRGNGVGSKSRERVLEIASHTLSKVSCLGFWGLGFSCLYAPLLCLRRGPRGARVEVLRLECRSIGAREQVRLMTNSRKAQSEKLATGGGRETTAVKPGNKRGPRPAPLTGRAHVGGGSRGKRPSPTPGPCAGSREQ